jgi:hypothetical protein
MLANAPHRGEEFNSREWTKGKTCFVLRLFSVAVIILAQPYPGSANLSHFEFDKKRKREALN